MSIAGRTIPRSAVVFAGLAMVVAAMMPVLSTSVAPEPREIRLVARDMAFYLEADPRTPNPAIDVRAGETVRITLRNDERGITHDFAVSALSAGLDPLKWGDSGSITFTAPSAPGSYEYECRPHRLMMRGILRVTR